MRLATALRIISCGCFGVAAACGPEAELHASSRRVSSTGELIVDSTPALEFWPSGKLAITQSERATAGTRLSSGEIALVDSRANQVRYFDAGGHLTQTFGRTGGGKDGFRAAMWVRRCAADSVFVWDPLELRVVVLDPNGKYSREFSVPVSVGSMNCSPNGRFARLMSPADMQKPKLRGESPRELSDVQILNSRGDTSAVIRRVRFAENRPLGRETFVGIAGDQAFVGTADSGFVDLYSLAGIRRASLEVATNARRTPTPEQYETAIDHLVDGLLSDDDRETARRYLRKVPPPATLPPYTGLFGLSDGTIWAKVSAAGDSQTVLRAVASSGRLRGEIHIPFDLTVLDIGTDYILGAYEQKRGKQRVVLYRVRLRQ